MIVERKLGRYTYTKAVNSHWNEELWNELSARRDFKDFKIPFRNFRLFAPYPLTTVYLDYPFNFSKTLYSKAFHSN